MTAPHPLTSSRASAGSRWGRGPNGAARKRFGGTTWVPPRGESEGRAARGPASRLWVEVAAHEQRVHAGVDILWAWSGRNFCEQHGHTTDSKTGNDDCHGQEHGRPSELLPEQRVPPLQHQWY